ncbi:three-Cys-motif partner protein TcmP [Hymenobacter negativus]|uniref:Three-Cys-motif partner protein TcmP n=1 Tax=Hymenobacter negativus TaxID=2795026 RepID=A0ABS0Q8H8_9BACT|nr:three-Cys-motif partner protein TcmP [Hymenobacter negativus]MBH8558968.1 three-Cys-motif partner protein TcmP [Hymenobacter negativus]
MPNNALSETFFNEQTEASRIKSKIVSKYLDGWSLILSSWAQKLVYADFFAGCGRYEDGSASTPLESISNVASRDSRSNLKNKIQFIFNELNQEFHAQLTRNIAEHLPTAQLRYSPIIQNQSFEELPALEQLRNWLQLQPGNTLPPSLVFVDPWGYRGLSLNHLGDILKIRGCEVIFFFNYNRINGALNNPFMKKHMTILFGQERADSLHHELAAIKKRPALREYIILQAVKENLRRAVHPQTAFVQEFKFKKGNRVSHFVIFATTHPKGFGLMKDIMSTESASYPDGLPSYQHSQNSSTQFGLFDGLVLIGQQLLTFYAGRNLTHKEVYDNHQFTGPYTSKNYKDALLWLEETHQVTVNPERSKRRSYRGRPTLGENVMITFP